VGATRVGGKATNGSGEECQTGALGGFLAAFEQSLQAETNAQKRDARANAFEECVTHLERIEGAHDLSEVSYAWQDDLRGASEGRGIANHFHLGADFGQRVLDGAEIARAVIEYRDQSRPFVDGN
jgi:hypothetical protein